MSGVAFAQTEVSPSRAESVAAERRSSDTPEITFDPDVEPPVFTTPPPDTGSRMNAWSVQSVSRWLRHRGSSLDQISAGLRTGNDIADDERISDPDGIAGLDATTSGPALFDAGPDVGIALGQQTGLTIGAGIEAIQSPDEHLDPPVFDAERYKLSIGVTHRTADDWTLKAGYQYGWLTDSSPSQEGSLSNQAALSGSSIGEGTDTDEADIEQDAHTVAIGISRKF